MIVEHAPPLPPSAMTTICTLH